MLFSDPTVAANLNNSVEPAWRSVRDVPLVTVDFGEGNVVRRTLHGNVATFVCDAEGLVFDALPGLYDAESYISSLNEILDGYQQMPNGSIRQFTAPLMREYHKAKRYGPQPNWLAAMDEVALQKRIKKVMESNTKLSDEGPAKEVLFSGKKETRNASMTSDQRLAELRKLLSEDSRSSQSSRWRIHKLLSEKPFLTPADMTPWLYREVLHADLEDPYLGLRDVLLGKYPYGEEHLIGKL